MENTNSLTSQFILLYGYFNNIPEETRYLNQ